ncbi:MAG: TIGR03435 family protein [Bryobacteraceae bacterium]
MARLLPLLIATFLGAWQICGQPPSQRPSFEVADIRPSTQANALESKERILPSGRVELPGETVVSLIMFAYSVQGNMIEDVPKWARDSHFDIIAKSSPNPSRAALRMMVQSLLAERFKLAFHTEDKSMAVFVLTVAKNGPRLQKASGGRQQCRWRKVELGVMRRECQNLTMSEFASQLPRFPVGIDRPVIDETGLKDAYDLQFEVGFVRPMVVSARDGNFFPNTDSGGPSIFSALEKIGLKLESRRAAQPNIAIDHVEPTIPELAAALGLKRSSRDRASSLTTIVRVTPRLQDYAWPITFSLVRSAH